jgi:hypothetical protein
MTVECIILECYTWWYTQYPLGYKVLNLQFPSVNLVLPHYKANHLILSRGTITVDCEHQMGHIPGK